jgi:hypothetical protein
MYKAEVVADSIGPRNDRCTSLVVTMPRIVLAEFNTHRMLSRNSASSRAIPFKKMKQSVIDNPFIPLKWMKEHSGMQGTEFFGERETFTSTNPHDKTARGLDADPVTNLGPGGTKIINEILKANWLWMRDIAVQEAERLNNCGVHYYPNGDTDKLTGDGRGLTKQMCNRWLEPWSWHTVLVTATEWENFFALRAHSDAEIHIHHVAELMLEAMNASTPKSLKPGEWHLPFGDRINGYEILEKIRDVEEVSHLTSAHDVYMYYAIKIATARCAQVSYTVVGSDEAPLDYRKLIYLHDRLLKAGHMSPFEHCARVMTHNEYNEYLSGDYGVDWLTREIVSDGHGFCGNFRGFVQYRKMFKDENRTDSRLIKRYYNGHTTGT